MPAGKTIATTATSINKLRNGIFIDYYIEQDYGHYAPARTLDLKISGHTKGTWVDHFVVRPFVQIWKLVPSGLSKLNFMVSRFGDSHGCLVKTVAIAKTAQ